MCLVSHATPQRAAIQGLRSKGRAPSPSGGANQETRHQLRLFVNARPQVHVTLIVTVCLLVDREARLLFVDVGPLLIELQMGHLQATHPLVKQLLTAVSEENNELAKDSQAAAVGC